MYAARGVLVTGGLLVGLGSACHDLQEPDVVTRKSSLAVGLLGATYDADGKADIAVWRPTNHNWYIRKSTGGADIVQAHGDPGDFPVPGDYDGDAKMDIAVWRPTNHNWYIARSSGGSIVQAHGDVGDLPVPGDYDGDGKTDIAVWRPNNHNWYIAKSSGGSITQAHGNIWDVPVQGDYDGDNKTDIAVWRPSDHKWYISKSSGGSIVQAYGNPGDYAVPGDYDGDGKTDIAVWRPSNHNWYIRKSAGGADIVQAHGDASDWPVQADYDGDGKTDIAVWRPSNHNWYIRYSGGGSAVVPYGNQGDIPPSWYRVLAGSTAPPMAPTQLAFVGLTDSGTTITFSYKDNNTAQILTSNGMGTNLDVFEVLDDGREFQRSWLTARSDLAGQIVTDKVFVDSYVNGTRSCIKIRLKNAYGTSMFSNIVCSTGAAPRPQFHNVGLGNGLLITSPDLTDMSYFPQVGSPFRVWWQVCNNGNISSPAQDIVLYQSSNGVAQNSWDFDLPNGVGAGQCIAQFTDVITVSTSVNFDLFINNQWRGGTAM
jgi:hypothetical protein